MNGPHITTFFHGPKQKEIAACDKKPGDEDRKRHLPPFSWDAHAVQ